MKRHLTNAGFGVVDYISYPVGMLLVAPLILRRLGPAEYGLWMVATAVISAGGILASGFCDACTQRVAFLRGAGEADRIPSAVRGMIVINLALGALFAAVVWIAAPYAARRIGAAQLTSPAECLSALRIAGAAIMARAIESVGVAVQRAFERYRETVQVSTAARLLTLAAAALLALAGYRTVSILIATVACLLLDTIAQFALARRFLGRVALWPRFDPAETRALLGQGFFAWVQAAGGVAFSQLDRILLGVVLGAAAVTPYSLCVQFAHPLVGLTASALHFTFPYFSSRAATLGGAALRVAVFKAFLCNIALVVCGAGVLLLAGDRLIALWAGPQVARAAAPILPPIVLGAALMGLSVTGTYAMQAFGRFRAVAVLAIAGRAAIFLLMVELLRRHGLAGLAASRLLYGAVALLIYLPLFHELRRRTSETLHPPLLAIAIGAQEASKP